MWLQPVSWSAKSSMITDRRRLVRTNCEEDMVYTKNTKDMGGSPRFQPRQSEQQRSRLVKFLALVGQVDTEEGRNMELADEG